MLGVKGGDVPWPKPCWSKGAAPTAGLRLAGEAGGSVPRVGTDKIALKGGSSSVSSHREKSRAERACWKMYGSSQKAEILHKGLLRAGS